MPAHESDDEAAGRLDLEAGVMRVIERFPDET
jgi:hypothetical protein